MSEGITRVNTTGPPRVCRSHKILEEICVFKLQKIGKNCFLLTSHYESIGVKYSSVMLV